MARVLIQSLSSPPCWVPLAKLPPCVVPTFPSLVFLSKMKDVYDLLTQPTCPEHIFWARHDAPGGWECGSRMPTLDSSVMIKIDRKHEPIHRALLALKSVL